VEDRIEVGGFHLRGVPMAAARRWLRVRLTGKEGEEKPMAVLRWRWWPKGEKKLRRWWELWVAAGGGKRGNVGRSEGERVCVRGGAAAAAVAARWLPEERATKGKGGEWQRWPRGERGRWQGWIGESESK